MIRFPYRNETSYNSDKEKCLFTIGLVDELLRDFPDIAATTTHSHKGGYIEVDNTKVDDIAQHLSRIAKLINHEEGFFNFKAFRIIVDTKNGKKELKEGYTNDCQFSYYKLLPVLNHKNKVRPLQNLFDDYGKLYFLEKGTDKEKAIDAEKIDLFQFEKDFPIKHTLDYSGKEISFSFYWYEMKASINKEHGIYQLSNPSVQSYISSKVFPISIEAKIDEYVENAKQLLRFLTDIDSVNTIERTTNNDIFLGNDKVIIFEVKDEVDNYYHRSLKTISISFDVHIFKDGLIITPYESIKAQKRRYPLTKEEIFQKFDDFAITVKQNYATAEQVLTQIQKDKEEAEAKERKRRGY